MPLIFYSVNTYLAYAINQRYYTEKHYVWCSEVFDARKHNAFGGYADIPPTANPYEIYHNLNEEVRRGDRHSAKIEANRRGIKQGAWKKFQAGAINLSKLEEIKQTVDSAEISEFRPLLYLIPYHNVTDSIREATIEERAHPLSSEYIIESLDRQYFDPIEVI